MRSALLETPDPKVDSVAFFDRTYEEALSLAHEARDYLVQQEAVDRSVLNPFDQLTESCEAMRLTSRLTQIIAWLLVQKAVHAGELTPEEAKAPERRLAGQSVCGGELDDPQAELPSRLTDLLARSRGLYERIERLDAMLDVS